MSSRLYFQDDSIQLIEINSDRNSSENTLQASSTLSKLKRNNKIDPPTIVTTNLLDSSSSNSKISDVFLIKNTNKPIPAPRKHENRVNTVSTSWQNQENNPDAISAEVLSQKSDTFSYKDRLRSRFMTVKKQAEFSVSPTGKDKSKQKLKDNLDGEDIELNVELSKCSHHIDESHDFFCKIFDNNTVETRKYEEMEVEEPNKKLVSEFLAISNLDTNIQEIILPYVVDYSLNESSLFINRKRFRDYKLKDNCEIRNFEDEGIYKSKMNHISAYQLAILEDRLVNDEKRNWLSSDGTLNIVPDPRLNIFCKPLESVLNNTDFINTYSPPTYYEPAVNSMNINENILEINLHNIKFIHHHLFSQEHVLANWLIKYYDEYKQIMSNNLLLINIKKLAALRNARNRLDVMIKQSGDCTENQMERYEKYSKEIKITRENIYELGVKEQQTKKTILYLWKTLKTLRKTQKYCNTSIKLTIIKETVDFDTEKQLFEQNVVQETNEILEELENDFQTEVIEYKIKLKQWKQDNITDKPCKPKRQFSSEQIAKEIFEKMSTSLKPPGEPNLDFELDFNNEIMDNFSLQEKLRRTNVGKTKIFAKILYNNRQICKTKSVTLDDNFVCNFDEQFAIKLYKIPTILLLQVYEHNNQITKRMLFEITFKIPEINEEIKIIEENFENKEIINYNHSAIGTGIDFDKIINDFNPINSKLFTSGYIKYSIGWVFDKNSEIIFENSHKDNNILMPTLFDIENLESWVQNHSDPLDPKNSLFFNYIKNLDHKLEVKYFRLNPDVINLEFCSLEDLENNLRFKLLNLRFNKEPEFKNMVVPNRMREINEEIFFSYENRKSGENISNEITQQLTEDIDNQRKCSKKILEQAENRLIELNKIFERKITPKDVLCEEIIPTFGSLGLSFINWLQPKRPLRPARKLAAKNTTSFNFKELQILVNIIGAIQVPNRKEIQNNAVTSSFIIDQLLNSVRPFVTVSFNNNCVRTTVAEGSNPIWNQEFNISLRNNNENFSAQKLLSIQENIIINLYDETVNDLILDDRIRDQNIHQHLGCNWLGNLEIPFQSLLENSRIEGTFKINLPQVLLGYERQSIKTFQETGKVINQKIDTFLTVFITLLPFVSNPKTNIICDLECMEHQFVEQFITNWETEYHNLFPKRKFSCFVTTLNGEKCCLTRFFGKIDLLPINFTEDEEIIDLELTKYVSLIPFRENGHIDSINDIWLNPEQILTLMMGSKNDHTVLLTCYLSTLGLKCWFLLGHSVIAGYTSYVLSQNKNLNYYIYDAKSGTKCNIFDNDCPLQKIFCVVNDENIWANIQNDDRISGIRLDFNETSDWLPLFNKDITAPTNLQSFNISYYDPASVLLLQERIEKKLRRKLMKWRKFSRTNFNHYCNAAFKDILCKLECKNMTAEIPEHFLEIQNLLNTYQIKGFARSFPYTNIMDLVEFLQNTGIHLNDNPNIEFSLSVTAHSYNNNAIIIWLFVAILIRKR